MNEISANELRSPEHPSSKPEELVMQDWYATRNGQRFGPYSQAEVELYFSQGLLTDSDQVWVPNWQRWVLGYEVRQAFLRSRPDRTPPNQASPVKTQPKPEPRRRHKPVMIILVLLCVATAIALVIHFWPDKTSLTVSTKALGTMSVNSSGGIFEKDDLRIEIDGSAGQSSYALEIFEIEAPIPTDIDVIDQSRTVVIEGNLSKISGDITVKLPIPETLLPKNATTAADFEGRLLFTMEEDVYVPSLGQSMPRRVFLPAKIDLDQKTITSTIRVDAPSSASLSVNPAGLSITSPDSEHTANQNEQIRISIMAHRYGYFSMTSRRGYFQVHSSAQVSQSSVSALLAELELQKQRIESLGFSFEKRTAYPIDVYLEDIEEMGFYEGSKFSSQGGILKIRRSFLEGAADPKANTDQWTLLVTTAGHELLHLVQAFYDSRSCYWKNSPWSDQPSVWLDEAVSTWYEAEAIGNPAYLSPNMQENDYFSERPLYFTKPEDDYLPVQTHGYGASLLIRHLTNRYGKSLPAKIYEHYNRQKADDQFAGRALNDALRDLGSSTGEAWVQFVEDLRQRPGSIIAGYSLSDSLGSNIRLEITPADGKVTFKPGTLGGRIVSNTSQEDSQANLKLKFSNANLMNQAFFLTPATPQAGEVFSDQKGEIRIQVKSTGACGLLVYTVAADGTSITRVAGAPNGFLASNSGPGGQTARLSQVTIPSFGSKPGSIREIRLVVVNYDDSSIHAASSLEVEISYGRQALDINGEWALSMVYDTVHYEGDIELLGTTYMTDIVPGEWLFFSNVLIQVDDQGKMYQEDIQSGSYLYIQYDETTTSMVFEIRFSVLLATMNGFYQPSDQSFTGPMENYVDSYGLTHSGRFRLTRIK
jgi:hypothetical protein